MAKYGREGHRRRIRQSYFQNGAENMSDVHIVELFLSLLIPRKDVKPIAYLLLNHFGKLEKIFSASYDELVSVDGIGDNTAVAIMLYNDLLKRTDLQTKDKFFQKNDRMAYAKTCLFGREKYNAVFVGADGEMLDNIQFDIFDAAVKCYILENTVKYKCPAIFVVRFGTQNIMGDDVAVVAELKTFLKTIGVAFLDYITAGIDACVSINDTKHYKLLEN